MAESSVSRPNVVWVMGDQHRGQALSCMGDPNVNTPTIDRLAREGVHLTTAVGGCPLCCPFRGSMLTGRYPHLCVPGHEFQMPPDQPTIAAPMKAAGYHTAYFGKWHVDGWKEADGRAAMHVVPPERRGGFDVWAGYDNNNAQWDCWVHGGQGEGAFHRRLDGYETDCLTDMLLEYLDGRVGPPGRAARQPDRPFFAVLSVQPPHDPYLAPREYMARHNPAAIQLRPNVPQVPRIVEQARRELAGYYAQIENLDWNLGRIVEALTRLHLAEDTIVMFFSDHGDMHGSHGQFRKTTPHEEALRVPFVIWRGLSRYNHRGGRLELPINHVDIAPTTLGLCGLDVPQAMRGSDLSGCFVPGRGLPDPPDSAFIQSVVPTMHGDSVDRPWRGVVTRDNWKYVCLEGQPWMLHDLNEDPYEQVNLALNSRFHKRRRELHQRLAQWLADTGDSFRLPEP